MSCLVPESNTRTSDSNRLALLCHCVTRAATAVPCPRPAAPLPGSSWVRMGSGLCLTSNSMLCPLCFADTGSSAVETWWVHCQVASVSESGPGHFYFPYIYLYMNICIYKQTKMHTYRKWKPYINRRFTNHMQWAIYFEYQWALKVWLLLLSLKVVLNFLVTQAHALKYKLVY